LGFSLIKNHALVDGNKRTGHAAMETFLVLNELEIVAAVDEQEQMVLRLADSQLGREDLTGWLKQKVRPIQHPEIP
jgi:death on curing protein